MEWLEIAENWVLLPRQQRGIIHFLGGAFIGATPHLTYRRLLEALAQQGFAIVATPFLNTFDHQDIAETVLRSFEIAVTRLEQRGKLRSYLPIYGLGHSLGCKLQLLIGSLLEVKRSGNILVAFNNYPAKRSIPFLDQVIDRLAPSLAMDIEVEFTPTPSETLRLIEKHYATSRNLLVKFRQDEIDQTTELYPILSDRFAHLTTLLHLPGNHLTPLGQDLQWQVKRSFSPLDAVGQWVRQELYKDLQRLEQELIRWLV